MENGPRDEDILLFIERRTGQRLGPLERADILAALDLDGAAAAAFMADFATAFEVDLAAYEADYHHRDTGRAGRFGWPLPVPHLFGLRLPLAVSTLAQAARRGTWPLRYPLLRPAPPRDWINWVLVLTALPLVAGGLLMLFRLF